MSDQNKTKGGNKLLQLLLSNTSYRESKHFKNNTVKINKRTTQNSIIISNLEQSTLTARFQNNTNSVGTAEYTATESRLARQFSAEDYWQVFNIACAELKSVAAVWVFPTQLIRTRVGGQTADSGLHTTQRSHRPL